MQINKSLILLFVCGFSFVCCSNGADEPSGSKPAMDMTILSSTATTVSLDVRTVNADYVMILSSPTTDTKSQTAKSVFEKGTKYTGSKIVVGNLSMMTTYTVFAVACKNDGTYGALQYVQFTTDATDPTMFDWEKSRNGILSFTDLVLCYGGSRHRSTYLWDKNRFTPFVTYVDKQGKEKWLFDSFLCIEFQTTTHSYMVGIKLPSAAKQQWQDLIDYWFGNNSGLNALEQAVKDASQRLGEPPVKRKVVMIMPDPIIYQQYADMKSSTKYWGQVNGRTMDFAQDKDRVTACKWYIDEVRKKFNEANYKYIELAGFYIVSEDLTTPNDGWNYELKHSDKLTIPVSEYLHALNQSLCWIPYNRAAGYKKWKELGIDYAYMQPNYFWDDKGEKPLPRFFSDIKANNLAMEFEFDEAVLSGKTNSSVYRQRIRDYMSNAKTYGTYGTKPLSYYHGENALYELWKSKNTTDQDLYHEFCQFVLDNPLRK